MCLRRVAGAGSTCHIRCMSDDNTATYPYTLEIQPPKAPGSPYQWAIRRKGKLIQRSDRNHPTEAKARENGMAQIELLLSGAGDR